MRDEEMVEKGMQKMALNMRRNGFSLEDIVRASGEDEETVQEWFEEDDDYW